MRDLWKTMMFDSIYDDRQNTKTKSCRIRSLLTMKLALSASFIASAAAFAPTQTSTRASVQADAALDDLKVSIVFPFTEQNRKFGSIGFRTTLLLTCAAYNASHKGNYSILDHC